MKAEFTLDGIVDEFAGRIFNHALRMLGSREDAEEVTQDVFMKIHRALPEFRGESQLSTWIWRITANACLTRLSRKKLQTVDLADLDVMDSACEAGGVPGPEEVYFARETREQLAQLISRLNPIEASVITLFYLQEMEYEEIARIMDLPMGSVATALHRGRKKLRMLYERSETVR